MIQRMGTKNVTILMRWLINSSTPQDYSRLPRQHRALEMTSKRSPTIKMMPARQPFPAVIREHPYASVPCEQIVSAKLRQKCRLLQSDVMLSCACLNKVANRMCGDRPQGAECPLWLPRPPDIRVWQQGCNF